MGNQRLIVTSPLLRAATIATVQGEPGQPVSVLDRRVELSQEPLNVAIRAGAAGTDVTYLGLAEPYMAKLARSELARHGLTAEIIEVSSACWETIEYVDRDGASRLKVIDRRQPSLPDVDRLLDRLGSLLEQGTALVVTASDLEGADSVDFVERVIGRAWGLGVRTVTAVSGASLRQAFHALPAAAFCEEQELIRISPAPVGVQETTEETLQRIFEDSVRVLLVLGENGIVRAASREATIELGPVQGMRPEELMGALAAKMIGAGEDHVGAAREAYAGLKQAVGVTLPESRAAHSRRELRETSS